MPRRSAREQIVNLTQAGRFSYRALATALGVSDRTLRRVAKGERELSRDRYDADVFEVLGILDKEIRTIEKREAKRQGYDLPDLPVQFPAQRDMWMDPRTGKRDFPGDSITFDVEKAREPSEIEMLLRAYRDRAALAGKRESVRFLVSTLKYRGQADDKGRTIEEMTYWWPTREDAAPDIFRMTNDDIADLFTEIWLDIGKDGEVIKVRVGDALIDI